MERLVELKARGEKAMRFMRYRRGRPSSASPNTMGCSPTTSSPPTDSPSRSTSGPESFSLFRARLTPVSRKSLEVQRKSFGLYRRLHSSSEAPHMLSVVQLLKASIAQGSSILSSREPEYR